MVFSALDKFDGSQRRPLTPSEIRQIAGRAGRYGFTDSGRVAVLSGNDISIVTQAIAGRSQAIRDTRPWLMPPIATILKIAETHRTGELTRILEIFRIQVMADQQDARAPAFDSMIAAAAAIGRSGLALETQWRYASAPIDAHDPQAASMISSWARRHARGDKVACPRLPGIEVPGNDRALLAMEIAAKALSLYLWLNQRFPTIYAEQAEAWFAMAEANRLIEQAMRLKRLDRACRSCGETLPPGHAFPICDPCFRAGRHAHGLAAAGSHGHAYGNGARRPSRPQRVSRAGKSSTRPADAVRPSSR